MIFQDISNRTLASETFARDSVEFLKLLGIGDILRDGFWNFTISGGHWEAPQNDEKREWKWKAKSWIVSFVACISYKLHTICKQIIISLQAVYTAQIRYFGKDFKQHWFYFDDSSC